jgi:hypothetical protein
MQSILSKISEMKDYIASLSDELQALEQTIAARSGAADGRTLPASPLDASPATPNATVPPDSPKRPPSPQSDETAQDKMNRLMAKKDQQDILSSLLESIRSMTTQTKATVPDPSLNPTVETLPHVESDVVSAAPGTPATPDTPNASLPSAIVPGAAPLVVPPVSAPPPFRNTDREPATPDAESATTPEAVEGAADAADEVVGEPDADTRTVSSASDDGGNDSGYESGADSSPGPRDRRDSDS